MIKNKTSSGFIVPFDFDCRTITEAMDKLNDIRTQDNREGYLKSFCLFELTPVAKTEEEELNKLLEKEKACLMKNKKKP